jgi:hypothetical protein
MTPSWFPAEIVSCVAGSAESVRTFISTATLFLIPTPWQSIGATTGVHETLSMAICFLT